MAIPDLSEAAHQPMVSVSGRDVTVFNGEIYNRATLRQELAAGEAGLAWRGTSDTESLLAAIDVWGMSVRFE